MNEVTEPPETPQPKRRWFEPVTALLMAVSSLSTAWCSYQSSRWNGQSSGFATHADKLERHATEMHLEAVEIEAAQTRLVMEVVDAHIKGDEKLERFYTDRFRAELKPAYEKWMALKPFDNLAAPPHPFVPGLYTPRFDQEIRDAQAQAASAEAESKAASNSASTYLSNTVALATVLFFAGTAGKFDQRRVRSASLYFASAMLFYAAARMFTLPVA